MADGTDVDPRLPAALADVEPGGAFFLHGDDELRKGEAARALVERHVDPSTRDFNLDRLRASEVDLEDLASLLATPPMMAEWRVVLLTETEALASSSRARELVVGHAEDPPPGLALILVAAIPDGSKARFYRDLKRVTTSVEFEEISQNDVPGWLMDRARTRLGTPMDEEAARALGAAVGTDLGILAQELEKLSGMVDEGETLTLEHVEAAGTRLPKQDRWNWFDLVGERKFDEALASLRTLLAQQGESGVGLAIGLGRHLLRIGAGVEGGRSAVEELLPRHLRGWLAPKLASQARAWSSEEVEEALTGLLRVDRQLKASGFSDEALLEQWLLERMVAGGEESAA